MIKSSKNGFINQAMNVNKRSKSGTFIDENILGYEELLSLAADNTVAITFNDNSTISITLAVNTHIAFSNVKSITSSGDVIIS